MEKSTGIETVPNRIRDRIEALYPESAQRCAEALAQVLSKFAETGVVPRKTAWDQSDVVLITYGDQVHDGERPTLTALGQFLTDNHLPALINTVHLLPFFPYSSDDGFSVIDYRQVADHMGDWEHVGQLHQKVDLMFDLVLNHCSQGSEWFQNYLAGKSPYDRFFHEVNPESDLSDVTRPRSLPLLTPFETSRGTRHLWTTFSADQIDLNFSEPDVLVEMIDILLFYVSQGARIVRLDAIAYLWKEIGTNCIHLPQTHEVVKLMHDVLDEVAPHVILLTETNVPHAENISYFGDGDEADMVYQFSLPPLLLDALLHGDMSTLSGWLANLDVPPEGTTFFNFTASHDGIGVRPLEGLVPSERIERLADHVRSRGGKVSTKRNSDGTDSPYELNVTYLDALGDADQSEDMHVARFLASQAIMLALPGIPGVYFHSLVGTPNDLEGLRESGQPRRINRRKYDRSELQGLVTDHASTQHQVFEGYKRLLAARIGQPAFHPDAECRVCDTGQRELLAFVRRSLDHQQSILVLVNGCPQSIDVDARSMISATQAVDLLTGDVVHLDEKIRLTPCGSMWLAVTDQ